MVSTTRQHVNIAYEAALNQAALYQVPAPGYLSISGETRKEYLQRQTSNDLGLLSTPRALPTLLPSAIGRILEVFTVLDEGEQLALLTQPGHGPGLAAYFQKHTFFNDQVTISDQSSAWMQIELHGPGAVDVLRGLNFQRTFGLDDTEQATWQGHQLRAVAEEGFGAELKFRLLGSAAASEELAALLVDLPSMDLAMRRVLRVEAGLAGDPEFNGEYTPFEVGLARLVSDEKGCYTGQEVLARQVTYDKVVRSLVRLRANQAIEPGAKVHAAGKAIGEVTSTAASPKLGAIALAVLRRPYDEPGTKLELKQDQVNHQASVF
jgi:folate-binding protein YgfZ